MASDASVTSLSLTFLDDLGKSFKAAFGNYTKETEDRSIPGMISIGYSHKVNNWLAIGGDIGYMRLANEITLTSNDGSQPTEYVNRTTSAFVVMPTGKFYYMQRSKMSLYGLVGAGFLTANKTESNGEIEGKDNISGFAFQVNPIGIRVGKRFAGFAELGVGMKGFGTIGFSMKL